MPVFAQAGTMTKPDGGMRVNVARMRKCSGAVARMCLSLPFNQCRRRRVYLRLRGNQHDRRLG